MRLYWTDNLSVARMILKDQTFDEGTTIIICSDIWWMNHDHHLLRIWGVNNDYHLLRIWRLNNDYFLPLRLSCLPMHVCKVLTSQVRRYMCDVFSQWLRLSTGRKWDSVKKKIIPCQTINKLISKWIHHLYVPHPLKLIEAEYPSLVQTMACPPVGAKLLSEPVLKSNRLDR